MKPRSAGRLSSDRPVCNTCVSILRLFSRDPLRIDCLPLDKSTIALVAFANDFVENPPHLGGHFETLETPPYRWRVGNSPGLVEPGTIHGASRARDYGLDRRLTTTLKLLQIMHGKGLVRRDETGHAHIYEATPEKDETRLLLARDLAERAFSGSTARLALHALSSARASAEEPAEIRALLDRLEGSS